MVSAISLPASVSRPSAGDQTVAGSVAGSVARAWIRSATFWDCLVVTVKSAPCRSAASITWSP